MESLTCLLWFLLLPAGFFLWLLISPRSVWQATSAWSFRNPEANEPSEAGYAMQRVSAALGIAFLIAFAICMPQLNKESEQREQEQRYEECLDDHRADEDESLLSPEDWCENLSPTPTGP